MRRVVIELLTSSSHKYLDHFHKNFMLNFPHVKKLGSKISSRDVLLVHFMVCERIYKTSKSLLEEEPL